MSENVLIRKLQRFGYLHEDDRALIRSVTQNSRQQKRRTDLIREGDEPNNVFLILEGLACRYKIDTDGNRQIVGLLAPGDVCDLHVFILDQMDHSIGTLTDCLFAEIPRPAILALLDRPAIAKALWHTALIDEATLREWVVNIGSRDADRRMAHLICEMHLRLSAVGMVSNGAFRLPITQSEFADLLGMSTVHVNRTMQALRETGMLTIDGAALDILDISRLQKFAHFNANYLHLKQQ